MMQLIRRIGWNAAEYKCEACGRSVYADADSPDKRCDICEARAAYPAKKAGAADSKRWTLYYKKAGNAAFPKWAKYKDCSCLFDGVQTICDLALGVNIGSERIESCVKTCLSILNENDGGIQMGRYILLPAEHGQGK